MDKGAWCAPVHGAQPVRHGWWLELELNSFYFFTVKINIIEEGYYFLCNSFLFWDYLIILCFCKILKNDENFRISQTLSIWPGGWFLLTTALALVTTYTNLRHGCPLPRIAFPFLSSQPLNALCIILKVLRKHGQSDSIFLTKGEWWYAAMPSLSSRSPLLEVRVDQPQAVSCSFEHLHVRNASVFQPPQGGRLLGTASVFKAYFTCIISPVSSISFRTDNVFFNAE